MSAARTKNDRKAKGRRLTSAALLVVDDLPNAPPVGTRELDVLDRLGALLDEVLLPSDNQIVASRDASLSQASTSEAHDKRKNALTS